MDFNEIVQTITTHALPVLLAITLHEAAHGYVAKLLGDNTAWALGRVTLNLLPWRLAVGFAQVERFGFFIVMGLVLLGVVNALWMTPIMNASVVSIQWLLQPLAHLFLLTTP